MSSRRRPVAALAALSLSIAACSQRPVDATPEGAVRELLDRMERAEAEGDEGATRAIFDLLAAPTRATLELRAARASAATARRVGPADMIAPAHFAFGFRPRQYKSTIAADHAVVEVVGLDPANDRASVTCMLESGHWRVEIPLPPLPPLQRRPDAGT